jgi:hypothetical protein
MKKLKEEYFNSIEELPIWNWWKISETGNLIYLHKDNNYEKEDYNLVELWNELQDEYLNEFGITEEFRQVLSLKKKWINRKSEFLITGDRFILNDIDIIESDIKETMTSKVTVNKDDTVIMLEEKLSFPLDPKKMSVKKYYSYINYYSKKK